MGFSTGNRGQNGGHQHQAHLIKVLYSGSNAKGQVLGGLREAL